MSLNSGNRGKDRKNMKADMRIKKKQLENRGRI